MTSPVTLVRYSSLVEGAMVDGEYLDDPELGDENDPEYRLELFETLRFMGTRPEELTTDPVFAAEYAAWLKTAQPDEQDD